MSQTSKPLSDRDANQALRGAFNDVDKSLTTAGFLTGKVGHKIAFAITTTSVPNDTEEYSYFDGTELLYTITIVYTSDARNVMISAARTA